MIRSERITFQILPAVRAILSKELMKKGLNQSEIADKLHITQPAVSQYIKKTRAKNVEKVRDEKKAREMLEDLAASMKRGKVLSDQEMEEVCRKIDALMY